MLRNLPNNYTHEQVVQMLNDHNFKGKYDFVYLPYDFSRHFSQQANKGYAFINFVSNEEACRAWSEFCNFDQWSLASKKVCDVNWTPLQGKDEHIKRYRDNPVMHPEVPDHYKPMIYDHNGNPMQFPKPVKPLRKPEGTFPVQQKAPAAAEANALVPDSLPVETVAPELKPMAAEAAALGNDMEVCSNNISKANTDGFGGRLRRKLCPEQQ